MSAQTPLPAASGTATLPVIEPAPNATANAPLVSVTAASAAYSTPEPWPAHPASSL